jgi:hypothetical protein
LIGGGVLDRLPNEPTATSGHSVTVSASASSVGGHRKPDHLRCLETDRQLELGRILYRQVTRILPFENAIDIGGRTTKDVSWIDA